MGRSALLVVLSGFGCVGHGSPVDLAGDARPMDGPQIAAGETTTALVIGDGWRIAVDHEDIFADPADPISPCGQESFREEYGGVEVDTGLCEHVSLIQPLRAGLEVGDTLRIVGWHSDLFAPDLDPVTGRIALAVGPQVIWDASVDIPADPGTWDVQFESPVAASTDTPVTLHVRNNGANTWNILSFTREERP